MSVIKTYLNNYIRLHVLLVYYKLNEEFSSVEVAEWFWAKRGYALIGFLNSFNHVIGMCKELIEFS